MSSDIVSVFSTHLLQQINPSVPLPAVQIQVRQAVVGITRKNPQRQRGVFGKRLHRRGWCAL